jgi:hypothetical protein
MLSDEAACHIAAKGQALAAALGLRVVWLPKQRWEPNSMDQLRKGSKGTI